MNEHNLINSLRDKTPEERREQARKAGLASAEMRKFASSFKAAFKNAMKEKKPIYDKNRNPTGEYQNGYEMAAKALASQIARGNVRAMEFAAKFLGEWKDSVKVEQEVKVKRESRINIDELSEEARKAFLELAEKEINKH